MAATVALGVGDGDGEGDGAGLDDPPELLPPPPQEPSASISAKQNETRVDLRFITTTLFSP